MSQHCPTEAHAAVRREWPLRSTLPLRALPSAVPCARAHAKAVMWQWDLAHAAQTVELIMSELVTNAVTATRELDDGPPHIRFWLLSDGRQVVVMVWDASPDRPVRMTPRDDVVGGRGLMLVEAISSEWDWYPVRDMIEGKIVWALVAPVTDRAAVTG